MACMDGICGMVSHQPVLGPWTREARLAEVASLHAQGCTDAEIAAIIHVHRETVKRYRRGLGLRSVRFHRRATWVS